MYYQLILIFGAVVGFGFGAACLFRMEHRPLVFLRRVSDNDLRSIQHDVILC